MEVYQSKYDNLLYSIRESTAKENGSSEKQYHVYDHHNLAIKVISDLAFKNEFIKYKAKGNLKIV